jgi:NAD(P)-dependent dehydrogenase (short-subunit alcohol dehydrogenase family)
MFQTDLLAGKRILVTGGGTGLGRSIAEKYLSLGAEIHICGRRETVLRDTAAELMAAREGGVVHAHAVDIRDADAVDRMVEGIFVEHGPLTGLVNNAAGNFVSRTEDLSPRGFNAISDIVMRGTFYVTHAVGRRWIAAGLPGSVVSIVVTWVFNAGPYVVPSAMSKSAVQSLTRSLAVEWGGYGIRLNAIAPGVFPTEGASARLAPGEGMAWRADDNPMRRVGEIHELQNLATFLMADGVDWLTGQVIAIDGGNWLANGGNFFAYRNRTDKDWRRMREEIKAQNARDKASRSASA